MKINNLIHRAIQKFVPSQLLLLKPSVIKARKKFRESPEKPFWLNDDLLKTILQQYPFKNIYRYDPLSLEKRGAIRSKRILKLLHPDRQFLHFLELGCNDGMTSCALHRANNVTFAIDTNSSSFNKQAETEGVHFVKMDATSLRFLNDCFDVVFSFDMFEHLQDPELVLQEALRVVKPSGYIYLQFGPLYYSANGMHLSKHITIPYCQFLFPKDLLLDYATELGFKHFTYLNTWSLMSYRDLWNKYSSKLKIISYKEQLDLSHVNLISRYPSCFKSKTPHFDNFLVTSIEVLFQKKPNGEKK